MIKVDMESKPNCMVKGTVADLVIEIEGALRAICEFASEETGKDKTDILNVIYSSAKDFWEKENEHSKS